MKGSVYALPLISVDVSTLTNKYQAVYSNKASFVIQLYATNHSNIPIWLSLDGLNDHNIILPYQSVSTNISVDNKGFEKGYFVRSDKSGSDKSGSDEMGKGMFYIVTYCINTGV
jgi:hypothetical protein